MANKNTTSEVLKKKFSDGETPIGQDFASLIDYIEIASPGRNVVFSDCPILLSDKRIQRFVIRSIPQEGASEIGLFTSDCPKPILFTGYIHSFKKECITQFIYQWSPLISPLKPKLKEIGDFTTDLFELKDKDLRLKKKLNDTDDYSIYLEFKR